MMSRQRLRRDRKRKRRRHDEDVARRIARKMLGADVWTVLDTKMDQAYMTIDAYLEMQMYLDNGAADAGVLEKAHA